MTVGGGLEAVADAITPKVVFMDAAEHMPPGRYPYIVIERCPEEGAFRATGWGYDENNAWEYYGSYPEDEITVERAIEAATQWGSKHQVTTVYVYRVVEGWDHSGLV